MHVRIQAPHLCAGLEINGYGFVIDAAPILRWAVGKPWREVRSYIARKRGWSWQQILQDGEAFPAQAELFAELRAEAMDSGIIDPHPVEKGDAD